MRAYYGASFLSYCLPTSLGGELYRGLRLSQLTGRKADVWASMLVEKLVGVSATVLLAWAGLGYLLTQDLTTDRSTIFLVLFAVTGALLLTLSLSLWSPVQPWGWRE